MTELSFSLVCARLFVNRHVPVWVALGVWLGGVAAGAAPGYRILVSSESGDIVSQLTWDGVALKTVKVVPVGIMPADIDGPHNVTVSPDGKYWYVTIAHGTPYGTLWKMAVDGDTLVGKAPVEMFPTTISLTPDGELAFVANSDFHGDHPRMNVEEGLEIDRPSLAITRRHRTGEGMLPQAMPMKMGHGGAQGAGAVVHDACMPTFVSVSPDDARLYVACNHSDELMVLDARTLELMKAIPTGHGAYNVEPSPDGKWVIATNKKDQSVSLIDAATLTEVARIPTTKPFPHGVAYSPDSRYAFVSQESKGVDPGAVNVIDLQTKTRVASIPVPLQPTGITILARP